MDRKIKGLPGIKTTSTSFDIKKFLDRKGTMLIAAFLVVLQLTIGALLLYTNNKELTMPSFIKKETTHEGKTNKVNNKPFNGFFSNSTRR
jgi:hypothetical protein